MMHARDALYNHTADNHCLLAVKTKSEGNIKDDYDQAVLALVSDQKASAVSRSLVIGDRGLLGLKCLPFPTNYIK